MLCVCIKKAAAFLRGGDNFLILLILLHFFLIFLFIKLKYNNTKRIFNFFTWDYLFNVDSWLLKTTDRRFEL